MHPKFDLTRVRTHDFKIMTVYFMSLSTSLFSNYKYHTNYNILTFNITLQHVIKKMLYWMKVTAELLNTGAADSVVWFAVILFMLY